MARKRYDYLFGTTTAAISDVDTTLTSAELANLPAVTAPDYVALVLHDGTSHEIVHVTDHTAAATTATITRGAEGSTAAAWASGADWLHGPTKYDIPTVGPDAPPADAPDDHMWFDTSEDPTLDADSVAVDDSGFSNVVGSDVQTALADIDGQLGAAPGGITVQDENGNVATGVTQLDFQGADVNAAAGSGEVVVTVSGGGGASPLWARKPANTARASTTTLADDPDLTVTLAASSTYRFEAMLMVYGPVGADFKFSFPRLNTNWSIYWSPIGPAVALASMDGTGAWDTAWNGEDNTRVRGTAESTHPTLVHVVGSVTTDATGGALKLQWAQNASNASAVTLYKGSHLMAIKVA